MPFHLVLLDAFPISFAIFFILSALAARWVYLDCRARSGGSRWEILAWGVGTFVALPIFLPMYLIAARPPGRLVRCPHCGRGTLAHRAACQHCGTPIAFDPLPAMWGLGEVVGIAIVFMFTLPLIAAALGIENNPTLAELSIFAVAQNVLFLALTAYVVRGRYRLPLPALGIRLERWPVLVLLGLAGGAATIPLSVGAERLATAVIGAVIGRARAESLATAEHTNDVLLGILRGPLTTAEIIWVIVLVCVIVPVGEEIFFRGFVFGALRRWGVLTAAGLSALFFGAVHQQIVHFLPVFLLGVVLALVYERTQSLLPVMVVHGVNNLVAILTVIYGWNI